MSKPKFKKLETDICAGCDKLNEDLKHEFHHIKPRHVKVDNSKENIAILCGRCHDFIEVLYEQYYAMFMPEYSWWKQQERDFNKIQHKGTLKIRKEHLEKTRIFREAFKSKADSLNWLLLFDSSVNLIRLSNGLNKIEPVVQPKQSKLRNFLKVFSI